MTSRITSLNIPNVRLSNEATPADVGTNRHPQPPREVWPLLVTIAATELTMAGVILWFSAPTVAPAALTGLGIGVLGMAALAFTLRLIGKMTASRPTVRAGSHTI